MHLPVNRLTAIEEAQLVGPLVNGVASAGATDHGRLADHGSHTPPLTRLLHLLRPEMSDLRVIAVFAVAVSLLNLATPVLVSELVNHVMFSIVLQPVLVLSLMLLFCLGLAAAMQGLQVYVAEFLQQRLFVRVVADFAYRLPNLRLGALGRAYGPELVNRFFDVLTVQKATALLLLDGLAMALQTVIGLTILGFYHYVLLGYALALVLALLFMVFVLGRGAVHTSIQKSWAKYAAAAWLEELARHPRAFKIGGGPGYALSRADHLAGDYITARQAHFRILLRQIVFALAVYVIASTALLGLGGWLVINQELTFGQLVAAELIVTLVVSHLFKLGKYLETYYDLLAAVDKLGHVIDLPLERTDGEDLPNGTVPAALRLRDLTFAYGHHDPLFRNLSVEVRPGERVALVGTHGAGKSTLLDLILGVREPTRGRLEFDGVDVRDLRLGSLRAQIGLVQGPELFEGTIAENLRMGRDNLPAADLRYVLATVGLLDDVQALPDGLNTQLATGGEPLSLGQSLRLTLARALVGRPRLLILDGTLDFLDLAAGSELVQTLFDPAAPWTLLIVTRRPEIIRLCDRTLALERASLGRADEEDHP